jgi:predicted Zn-dependent peptidase
MIFTILSSRNPARTTYKTAMTKSYRICILLLLTGPVAAVYADTTFTIGAHTFHQQILDNGLLALALQSTNELADVYLAVDVGRRHESIKTSGIAHMTEHAMFAGTQTVPAQAFEARIRAFGGRANAFTREDYTLYYDIKIPMDELDPVLDMEADRLVNLAFEETAFRFEQERLKKEEAGDDRIADQLHAQADAVVFPGHAYGSGERVKGFTKAPAFSAETVRAFYKEHYHPRHAAVLIVSREAPQQTLARIAKGFGVLPAGPERPASEPVPSWATREINVVKASGLRSQRVEYLWRIPPIDAPEHHAWLLLGTMLNNRNRTTDQGINVVSGNRLAGDNLRLWATGDDAKAKLDAALDDLKQHPFKEEERDLAIDDLADDFLELKIHSRPYFSLPATVVRYAANKHAPYVVTFPQRVGAVPLEQIHALAESALLLKTHGMITFKASGEARVLPDTPQALAKFAADAQEAGNHADAIEAYTRLLEGKLNTMFKIIYLASRGQVYLDTRDYDAAIADFKTAMKLSDYPALPPLLAEAERLKASSMARLTDDPPPASTPVPDESPKDLKQELFDLIPVVSAELEAWRTLKFKTPVTVTFTNNPPEDKLGGWYDSETKQLVVSIQDDRPQFSKGVLYHELFHALQDQHFDLLKLHHEADDPDSQRALTALIEGEAMLAVSELMDYNFLAHAGIRDKGPIPPATFEKKFHYGAGLRFILDIRQGKGWSGVSDVFRAPPKTSLEIYHPEVYPLGGIRAISWTETASDIRQTGMYDVRWLFTRPVETRKEAIRMADTVRSSSQAQLDGKHLWKLRFSKSEDVKVAREFIVTHAEALGWNVTDGHPVANELILVERNPATRP